MLEVIPTILTNDIREIEAKLKVLEEVTDRVQIDIVDGQFVDNKTIDPSSLEGLDTTLKIDFHLMTKEPIGWVERCLRGGADRIIGQIEKMQNQIDFVGKVQETGSLVGLALDILTPVSGINEEILGSLDVILTMDYPAGFGGQQFNPKVLEKISELGRLRKKKNYKFRICADGGIDIDNIGKIVESGGDEVCVGRRLFTGDVSQNIRKLKEAV